MTNNIYTIYLAGGMTGLTPEEQVNWRRDVEIALRKYNVRVFVPPKYYNEFNQWHDSEREVMDFDLHNLVHSDLVIMNFNAPTSLGSMAELGIAYDRKIPVIGLNEANHDLHPWQTEMTLKMFYSLDNMIEYVINYFIV